MSGHCYVVVFSNKTAKIGKTKDLVQRMRTHKRDGRKFGLKVEAILFTERLESYDFHEESMLNYWRNGDGEYFFGKTVEDAEAMMFDIGLQYTKCVDIKPTGDSSNISAVINVGGKERKSGSQKMSARIARALEREGGEATFGRLCNRFRREDKAFIASTLMQMEAKGEVRKRCEDHPQNGTIIEHYSLV